MFRPIASNFHSTTGVYFRTNTSRLVFRSLRAARMWSCLPKIDLYSPDKAANTTENYLKTKLCIRSAVLKNNFYEDQDYLAPLLPQRVIVASVSEKETTLHRGFQSYLHEILWKKNPSLRFSFYTIQTRSLLTSLQPDNQVHNQDFCEVTVQIAMLH